MDQSYAHTHRPALHDRRTALTIIQIPFFSAFDWSQDFGIAAFLDDPVAMKASRRVVDCSRVLEKLCKGTKVRTVFCMQYIWLCSVLHPRSQQSTFRQYHNMFIQENLAAVHTEFDWNNCCRYFCLFVILKNIPELQSKPCRFLCYPHEYARITLKTTLKVLILKAMLEVSSELLWRFWFDRRLSGRWSPSGCLACQMWQCSSWLQSREKLEKNSQETGRRIWTEVYFMEEKDRKTRKEVDFAEEKNTKTYRKVDD